VDTSLIRTRILSETLDEGSVGLVASRFIPTPLAGQDTIWLRILARGLGHRPFLIFAEDLTGQMLGFLPLALVQSPLFGRFLVSLPYLNSGGVCSSHPEAAIALVDRAVELADELDVKHLELRHEVPIEHPKLTVSRTDKVHMRLALPESPEALMKSYKSKLRSQVKKTSENPFELVFGGEELLIDFYNVFATNMRDLGTPVTPKDSFKASSVALALNRPSWRSLDYTAEPLQVRCLFTSMLRAKCQALVRCVPSTPPGRTSGCTQGYWIAPS
jgi:hypothetical protein